VLKLLIIIIGGAWFLYALLKKPDWIAVMFFTIAIADINFDPPGSPLNFRTLICLVLFLKVITDKYRPPGVSFMNTPASYYVMLFIGYVIFITWYNDLLTAALVKELLLSFMCVFLAYYYYMKEGGYRIFKLSLVISGFICLADLAWTYKQGYGLFIQRIYYMFVPAFEVINHNFFGYICAGAFVFLLGDYLVRKDGTKWNLWAMPCMFLGVMLSTSRSALLIMVIISVVLIARGILSKENNSRAYRLIVVSLSCLILCLFMFPLLSSLFGLDSEFLETITSRLIDEPLAILNRALGKSFDVQSLDSMDWRAEASEIAMNAFTNVLTPGEKIFGIGNDGFMDRGLGYLGTYAAHNGILLMLIEFGIIGFTIFHLFLIYLIVKTSRKGYFSPLSVVLLFIFLYVISHNRETTSLFAFLLMGTMVGELEYVPEEEEEEVEEIEPIAGIPYASNNLN